MIKINPFSNPKRYAWGNNAGDKGMGYFFADAHKDIARFVEESKCWYVYSNTHWKKDSNGNKVAELAKTFTDYMIDCHRHIDGEDVKRAWIGFCGLRMKNSNRNIMIKEAASVHPISITEFDKNPWLLNCQNYTLNLKTNKAYKHRPSDLLSKVANVEFDKNATCERWEQFIKEIMQDDNDKADFLQKALGYSLTGVTNHECMFILYGAKHRNGKGTTMETILHLLGDYGKSAQPETIMSKQNPNSSAPNEDIARLKGARFVNISEPEKGLRLNEALVKRMTGNDTLTARFLNENSFEYKPEFKLFVNTNHKPIIRDIGVFVSGRIHLIPFERHFEPHEQDKNLKEFFREPENLSGILNWCIVGLKDLVANGISPPEVIVDATSEYKQESDIIGQFISDCLIKMLGHNATFKQVNMEYVKWCDGQQMRPMSSKSLSRELQSKGIVIRNGVRNTVYVYDTAIVEQGDDNPFLDG